DTVRLLKNGDVPGGNPPVFRNVPPTVDFLVTDPGRGVFLVRMIDYSGELIHPGEEHRVESDVRALKECLASSDGFLVLAETPHSTMNEGDILSDELSKLREAFASLSESKKDAVETPIGVILTKWDRYSEVDFESPSEELGKVTDFLTENPAHDSLIDSVSNASVTQAALGKVCVRNFADGKRAISDQFGR
ncbi:MAG: hypothetical protein ACC658_07875, partial [Acidimicrobiia bacterium]